MLIFDVLFSPELSCLTRTPVYLDSGSGNFLIQPLVAGLLGVMCSDCGVTADHQISLPEFMG